MKSAKIVIVTFRDILQRHMIIPRLCSDTVQWLLAILSLHGPDAEMIETNTKKYKKSTKNKHGMKSKKLDKYELILYDTGRF